MKTQQADQILLNFIRPLSSSWTSKRCVTKGKVYTLFDSIDEETLIHFTETSLKNPALHQSFVNEFNLLGESYILVSKKAGVTDDEGHTLQEALNDYLGREISSFDQTIFSQDIYFFEERVEEKELNKIANSYLGNPLIHEFKVGAWAGKIELPPQTVDQHPESFITIPLSDDSEGLLELSKERHLALNKHEMEAIQLYYKDEKEKTRRELLGLPIHPTDCELEILAQTWSEHCKHKEFNATIDFNNEETGERRVIHSLFNTFIKGATDCIDKKLRTAGQDWLIKVFTDNAGIVAIDQKRAFVWKVETHNTPSALDPYGGAITGILGNNRDVYGTGIGGAKPIFNTNVLCFAPPDTKKTLLKGQLHPMRVLQGVVKGIQDGGNKSGIPTVAGALVFDERYGGKPLVYCGTGGILEREILEKDTSKKPIAPGDRILMAGGRVGKDGIHGATLSSLHIEESTPQTMVQIGSPYTQKKLCDFLREAASKGLIKTCTDNGAGGLSSSIGELAMVTGGAEVHLERVPLKYTGLRAWEIFVSESQERMTLVVTPEKVETLLSMADEFEVELSDIGSFTNSGSLEVLEKEQVVASLDLHFLHEGLPKKEMEAIWKQRELKEPSLPKCEDFGETILKLLNSLNVCSKESVIRRYDHEVQGRSILKPLMGPKGAAPQDAAVVRVDQYSHLGLAISHGILPRYGDIDPYQMSAGAFDEGVRQIIAVGGSLPGANGAVWSVNDNFCLPDSAYDPVGNPDGKEKLGSLVRMCEALYDLSTAYSVPLTSGKDSMKNDFRDGEKVISIPPTILFSMVATIPDIRKVCSSEFKLPGDLIYLLGETCDELGGSEYYHLFGEIGANVPKVHVETARDLYHKVSKGHAEALFASCHDLSDGGLAVALAESCFGGDLGAKIQLPKDLSQEIYLFSESHSRFLVSIAEEKRAALETLFGKRAIYLGKITEEKTLSIDKLMTLSNEKMKEAWQGRLVF